MLSIHRACVAVLFAIAVALSLPAQQKDDPKKVDPIEQKKLDEAKAAQDKQAAEEEQAEQKQDDRKSGDEKDAEQKAADEKKAAEEQAILEQKKAEDERQRELNEKRAAEEQEAAAEKKDVDQKGVDQSAIDRKAIDQKNIDQKALDQKAIDQKTIDQKALDQKAIDQKPVAQQPSSSSKPRLSVPGAAEVPELRGNVIPNVLGFPRGNWDFELGDLRTWHCDGASGCAGTAFANQPTSGDNVAARIPGVSANHQGTYWIGTYENHPPSAAPLGSVQGDGPTGVLVSERFRIASPYIRFRVGGGTSARGVRVQLVTTEDVESGGLLLEASGEDSETMRTVTWDVRRFEGQECFIRIVDRGSGPWGHINVDDFRFDSSAPAAEALRGWDFESLEDVHRTWTFEGEAFARQPTYGDNVTSSRLGTPAVTLARTTIGGNYWDVPFSIGHQGNYWIGTYENRGTPGEAWGTTRGDAPTGTMTSAEFEVTASFLSFLVGGGGDMSTERVELLVNGAPVLQTTGRNSELMRREVWNVSSFRGSTAQIRVIDAGSGGWGHINVDDFRFTSELPAPSSSMVWGFADTHAHPMAHLGFGGQLYWGSPEGPYATALPPCEPAHGIHGTGLRDAGGIANLIAAVLPAAIVLGAEEVGRWAEDQAAQWTTGHALPPRSEEERTHQLMEAIGRIVQGVEPDVLLQLPVIAVERRTGHRTHGWPEMDGWPRFDSPMHQHMHEEWIRRAYQGGLRLMVAHVVNTRIIGDLRPRAGSALDDRAQTDAQLDALHRFAERNRPWMEIARTPADARRIIGENKLAIVLGVEVDSINDWRSDAGVTNEAVDSYLRYLYRDKDVRHIFPIHLAMSPFGAPSLYDDIFNFNSWTVTGSLQDVRDGADPRGAGYEVQFRLLEDMPDEGDPLWEQIRQIVRNKHLETLTLPSGRTLDVMAALAEAERKKGLYDAVRSGDGTRLAGHLHAQGLTPLGRHAIEQMMNLGMIVDVDHMSDLSTEETLTLAEGHAANGLRGYPLASGHSSFREIKWRRGETSVLHKLAHESDKRPDVVARMRALGGIMAPITTGGDVRPWGRTVLDDAPGTSKSWAQAYLYAIDHMGGRNVALGTDMAVLGGLGPRFGSWAAIGTKGDELKSTNWFSNPSIRLTRNPPREGHTYSEMYRRDQADSQRNGVRYIDPIRNVLSYRFEGPEDLYTGEERDLWAAIIEGRSGANIDDAQFGGEIAGYRTPGLVAYMKDVAKGVRAAVQGRSIDTLPIPDATTNNLLGFYNYAVVQRGAWLGYNAARPETIADDGIRTEAVKIARIARVVRAMDGSNPPMTRLVVGNHDFDFNLDGLANYGLLPDMLQDVRNVGVGPAQMAPLFRSAEDYIQMWEKAERMKTVR